MSRIKVLCLALLIPFTALTVYAVSQVGFFGIFEYQLHSPAGWQVIVDLIIACALILVWMFSDAKKHGRNVWPYVVVTLVAGSFGPLLYLLFASNEPRS